MVLRWWCCGIAVSPGPGIGYRGGEGLPVQRRPGSGPGYSIEGSEVCTTIFTKNLATLCHTSSGYGLRLSGWCNSDPQAPPCNKASLIWTILDGGMTLISFLLGEEQRKALYVWTVGGKKAKAVPFSPCWMPAHNPALSWCVGRPCISLVKLNAVNRYLARFENSSLSRVWGKYNNLLMNADGQFYC